MDSKMTLSGNVSDQPARVHSKLQASCQRHTILVPELQESVNTLGVRDAGPLTTGKALAVAALPADDLLAATDCVLDGGASGTMP